MPLLRCYEPINQLKPVADGIWLVDGPVVRMRYWGLQLPFTTRMTIARLADGRLWIHSPTELTPGLARAIDELGPAAFIIAPNRLHTSWLQAWKTHWPDAVSAGIAAEPAWNGTRMVYGIDLGGGGPFPWCPDIEHCLVPGSSFSEMLFFHVASRTLIVTDLVENFELSRIRSAWWRLLLRMTGPLDPHGTAPPDMRYTFRKHHDGLRRALQQIRDWAPSRVVIAHGRWYQQNGLQEMERAFAWVR